MKLRGISRSVVVLGFVALLNDMAGEMLYPIIPLFITGSLGQSMEALGLIEGIANGIATGLNWIGGVLSDLSRQRKPFVLLGYAISALSKPVMGLSALVGGAGLFLAGRSSDRLGKSVRNAARDALIADATAPEYRGVAYGLHRAMDTTGAIAGPLLALLILWCRPQTPLYWLFFVALAPGIATVLLTALAVRDIPHAPAAAAARSRLAFWQHYSPAFLQLLIANAIFSLGNSADSFLLIRATGSRPGATGQALHDSVILATEFYVAFNITYAALSTPAGKISDKIPRKLLVTTGWVIYAAVYAGFAAFDMHGATPWLLFLTYGLYQALTDGITKAYVTDLVPKAQRAGAIGLFNSVGGAAQLLASLLTGWMWVHVSVTYALLLGTIFSLAAIPVILLIRKPRSAPAGQEKSA